MKKGFSRKISKQLLIFYKFLNCVRFDCREKTVYNYYKICPVEGNFSVTINILKNMLISGTSENLHILSENINLIFLFSFTPQMTPCLGYVH